MLFSLLRFSSGRLFEAAIITSGKQSQRKPKNFAEGVGTSIAAAPMRADGRSERISAAVPCFFAALCDAVCHSSRCLPLIVIR